MRNWWKDGRSEKYKRRAATLIYTRILPSDNFNTDTFRYDPLKQEKEKNNANERICGYC